MMKAPIPSPFGDISPGDLTPPLNAATPGAHFGLHACAEAVTIAYQDSFWGELRNQTLFTLLHPITSGLLLLVTTMFALLPPLSFLKGAMASFPARWLLIFGFQLFINIVITTLQIFNGRDPQRGETMTLRPHELEYTSPVKVRHIRWRNVKTIINAIGYIYFVRLDGATYVPHAAFPTPAARRLFLEAARTLQQSRGATWPSDKVTQMSVPQP